MQDLCFSAFLSCLSASEYVICIVVVVLVYCMPVCMYVCMYDVVFGKVFHVGGWIAECQDFVQFDAIIIKDPTKLHAFLVLWFVGIVLFLGKAKYIY